MKLRFLAMLFLMALTGVLAAQVNGEPESGGAIARVEVLIFDAFGGIIPDVKIDAFEDEKGKNHASRFENGVATGIPFGEYRIEVSHRGFVRKMRFVSVSQPRETIVIELQVGSVGGPTLPYRIRGRVVGSLPPGRKTFVKVTRIFSNYSIESGVESNGTFEVTGLYLGLGLLMVINQDSILASQLIQLPVDSFKPEKGGPILEIELGTEPLFRWP